MSISAQALRNLSEAEREVFWELAGKYQYEGEMSQEKADEWAFAQVIDRRLGKENDNDGR